MMIRNGGSKHPLQAPPVPSCNRAQAVGFSARHLHPQSRGGMGFRAMVDPNAMVSYELLTDDGARELSVGEVRETDVERIGPDGNFEPMPGGVMDAAMGPASWRSKSVCGTCAAHYDSCPGHGMHIELCYPCVVHHGLALGALWGICVECGELLPKRGSRCQTPHCRRQALRVEPRLARPSWGVQAGFVGAKVTLRGARADEAEKDHHLNIAEIQALFERAEEEAIGLCGGDSVAAETLLRERLGVTRPTALCRRVLWVTPPMHRADEGKTVVDATGTATTVGAQTQAYIDLLGVNRRAWRATLLRRHAATHGEGPDFVALDDALLGRMGLDKRRWNLAAQRARGEPPEVLQKAESDTRCKLAAAVELFLCGKPTAQPLRREVVQATLNSGLPANFESVRGQLTGGDCGIKNSFCRVNSIKRYGNCLRGVAVLDPRLGYGEIAAPEEELAHLVKEVLVWSDLPRVLRDIQGGGLRSGRLVGVYREVRHLNPAKPNDEQRWDLDTIGLRERHDLQRRVKDNPAQFLATRSPQIGDNFIVRRQPSHGEKNAQRGTLRIIYSAKEGGSLGTRCCIGMEDAHQVSQQGDFDGDQVELQLCEGLMANAEVMVQHDPAVAGITANGEVSFCASPTTVMAFWRLTDPVSPMRSSLTEPRQHVLFFRWVAASVANAMPDHLDTLASDQAHIDGAAAGPWLRASSSVSDQEHSLRPCHWVELAEGRIAAAAAATTNASWSQTVAEILSVCIPVGLDATVKAGAPVDRVVSPLSFFVAATAPVPSDGVTRALREGDEAENRYVVLALDEHGRVLGGCWEAPSSDDDEAGRLSRAGLVPLLPPPPPGVPPHFVGHRSTVCSGQPSQIEKQWPTLHIKGGRVQPPVPRLDKGTLQLLYEAVRGCGGGRCVVACHDVLRRVANLVCCRLGVYGASTTDVCNAISAPGVCAARKELEEAAAAHNDGGGATPAQLHRLRKRLLPRDLDYYGQGRLVPESGLYGRVFHPPESASVYAIVTGGLAACAEAGIKGNRGKLLSIAIGVGMIKPDDEVAIGGRYLDGLRNPVEIWRNQQQGVESQLEGKEDVAKVGYDTHQLMQQMPLVVDHAGRVHRRDASGRLRLLDALYGGDGFDPKMLMRCGRQFGKGCCEICGAVATHGFPLLWRAPTRCECHRQELMSHVDSWRFPIDLCAAHQLVKDTRMMTSAAAAAATTEEGGAAAAATFGRWLRPPPSEQGWATLQQLLAEPFCGDDTPAGGDASLLLPCWRAMTSDIPAAIREAIERQTRGGSLGEALALASLTAHRLERCRIDAGTPVGGWAVECMCMERQQKTLDSKHGAGDDSRQRYNELVIHGGKVKPTHMTISFAGDCQSDLGRMGDSLMTTISASGGYWIRSRAGPSGDTLPREDWLINDENAVEARGVGCWLQFPTEAEAATVRQRLNGMPQRSFVRNQRITFERTVLQRGARLDVIYAPNEPPLHAILRIVAATPNLSNISRRQLANRVVRSLLLWGALGTESPLFAKWCNMIVAVIASARRPAAFWATLVAECGLELDPLTPGEYADATGEAGTDDDEEEEEEEEQEEEDGDDQVPMMTVRSRSLRTGRLLIKRRQIARGPPIEISTDIKTAVKEAVAASRKGVNVNETMLSCCSFHLHRDVKTATTSHLGPFEYCTATFDGKRTIVELRVPPEQVARAPSRFELVAALCERLGLAASARAGTPTIHASVATMTIDAPVVIEATQGVEAGRRAQEEEIRRLLPQVDPRHIQLLVLNQTCTGKLQPCSISDSIFMGPIDVAKAKCPAERLLKAAARGEDALENSPSALTLAGMPSFTGTGAVDVGFGGHRKGTLSHILSPSTN